MCVDGSNKKKLSAADIHNQEHERWNRRSFLKALGIAGGGSMVLANTTITASQPSALTQAIANAETDRILVLIRLKGGNDGLNTIVPIYDYDNYANLRPNIRHLENALFKLDDDFGIPASMSNMQSLWGEGAMKVFHGIGYENQDLSHFKSSDIYASADTTDEEDSGYMGRYFEGLYPDFLANPPEIPAAIQIGSVGNLIFDGQGVLNYAMTVANPGQLERIGQNGLLHGVEDLPDCTYGDRLKYLRSMANNTYTYSKTIAAAYENSSDYGEYLAEDSLADQLRIIARMIKGGLGTRVYMISLGGFDTHGNQIERHDELMYSVSHGVKTFFEDLATVGMENNVLATTISEFGRRAAENGSEGTDHGQAAPILMFSPALDDNGFYGEHPSLTALDRIGNMQYTVDFREVYAGLMKEWLCVDPETVDRVLLGETFESQYFGFSCSGLTGPIDSNIKFFHQARINDDGTTTLVFEKGDTTHVNASLYSVTGQHVATIVNDMLGPGEYGYPINPLIGRSFSQGIYIYRILSGEKSFSNQVFVG